MEWESDRLRIMTDWLMVCVSVHAAHTTAGDQD